MYICSCNFLAGRYMLHRFCMVWKVCIHLSKAQKIKIAVESNHNQKKNSLTPFIKKKQKKLMFNERPYI